MEAFSNALLKELLANKNNLYSDNYDKWMKYEAEFLNVNHNLSFLQRKLPLTKFISDKFGITHRFKDLLSPKTFYKKLVPHFTDCSLLYNLLSDEASKALLTKILAYRILGYQKVKLPRNTKKYWEDIESIRKLDKGQGNLKINFLDIELILLNLASLGYNIKLNATPEGVACTFIQHQYEYKGKDFVIKAEKGDVVLDCGACWGDTTLYFSHEVGSDGKVYAFEFLPDNLNVLNKNISQNPHLADSIQIIEHPVWDVSNKKLSFANNGPGTQVRENDTQDNTQECETISIDDFVEKFNVKKVDFIKMDIEGAELNALRGAEKTIKKFQPKLAISAYHKFDDFVTLPGYLNSLNVGYEFYLEHHTIHKWETVIYARPARK